MLVNVNNSVFEDFHKKLSKRLSTGVLTTEDSVRYTLFASFIEVGNVSPEEVILEYPHPNIGNARIDTYIHPATQSPIVIEFKFHRRIPSRRNVPRPQMAGALFKDIGRLCAFDETSTVKRYLVYLTDDEMAGYMQNEANGCDEFFRLPKGKRYKIDHSFFASKSISFNKIAGSVTGSVETVITDRLSSDYELRVYEVFP